MNAQARPLLNGGSKLADPLDVLTVRADVHAYLVSVCASDLHDSVDTLQTYAETSGLVDRIGQDAVQEIIAGAFSIVGLEGAA